LVAVEEAGYFGYLQGGCQSDCDSVQFGADAPAGDLAGQVVEDAVCGFGCAVRGWGSFTLICKTTPVCRLAITTR
jgi:hypothetical protein